MMRSYFMWREKTVICPFDERGAWDAKDLCRHGTGKLLPSKRNCDATAFIEGRDQPRKDEAQIFRNFNGAPVVKAG